MSSVAHVGIAYTGTIISYTHDGNKCIHDDIVGMHVAVERVYMHHGKLSMHDGIILLYMHDGTSCMHTA